LLHSLLSLILLLFFFFFSTHTPPTQISTLSLHDALPILAWCTTEGSPGRISIDVTHVSSLNGFGIMNDSICPMPFAGTLNGIGRSEEHTSELQSRGHLVCRLLLEKKK